jgi:hypothetical protein
MQIMAHSAVKAGFSLLVVVVVVVSGEKGFPTFPSDDESRHGELATTRRGLVRDHDARVCIIRNAHLNVGSLLEQKLVRGLRG